METTVKERLIKYLKNRKVGQNKFERMAGISNGYISHLKTSPSIDILMKILDAAPDLNQAWLLTGEGEMLLPQKESTSIMDNSTSVAGNSNQVNATSTLDKALDEIAAQRRLVEKAQEQIDRLITLLERNNQ